MRSFSSVRIVTEDNSQYMWRPQYKHYLAGTHQPQKGESDWYRPRDQVASEIKYSIYFFGLQAKFNWSPSVEIKVDCWGNFDLDQKVHCQQKLASMIWGYEFCQRPTTK